MYSRDVFHKEHMEKKRVLQMNADIPSEMDVSIHLNQQQFFLISIVSDGFLGLKIINSSL